MQKSFEFYMESIGVSSTIVFPSELKLYPLLAKGYIIHNGRDYTTGLG